MTIQYYKDLIQGSDEWLNMRCGVLTASEMKHIITPSKLEYATNDKSRAHLNEIIAQRITRFVEPHYISDDMLRGMNDEIEAKALYAKHYSHIDDMGFITNDKYGFVIGYSPDGMVGERGLIECKSRRSKYQIETIIKNKVPEEYILQLQTGLLVSEREWIDFISYCGGLPMYITRVHSDPKTQMAIVEASAQFNKDVEKGIEVFTMNSSRFVKTERKVEQEIMV